MTFDFEKYVPGEKTILLSDRLTASSRTLFQIVREFFEPHFLLHQIEFGEGLCWIGFRPIQTGNEEIGWVRIESSLGVKEAESRRYVPLDIPRVAVGSVSIRSLSPIASRVLVRTNYTPEVLSFLFKGLVQYLIWVVNGEEAHEAWSRAVSDAQIKVVLQMDARETPFLLEAPSEATDHIPGAFPLPADQKMIRKTKPHNHRRASRKQQSGNLVSAHRRAKQRIYVPLNPIVLERWRKMRRIIRQTQRAYQKLKNDDLGWKPNPTLDELREAIAEKLGKKPSEKTVTRVIQADNAGLLKKKR